MSNDVLLTETIARHFPDARIVDGDIELGFGDLRMKCWVNQILSAGTYKSASLFFNLRGGALGPSPIFISVSGYEESPERAIVVGACNWACSFGPVLQAALGGTDDPKVERFESTVDGQRFRVFIDGLDRFPTSELAHLWIPANHAWHCTHQLRAIRFQVGGRERIRLRRGRSQRHRVYHRDELDKSSSNVRAIGRVWGSKPLTGAWGRWA